MKRFLTTFLGSLAALVVVLLILAAVAALMLRDGVDVKDDSYLVIKLVDQLPEYDPPSDIISQLVGEDVENLQRILTNLDKARVDDRIKGVIFRVGLSAQIGSAAIQEIHQAIARVQHTGKKVYGWAEGLTTQSYFLVAACDNVFAPPSSPVLFTGFDTEVFYLKQMLDKIGVKADLHKIKDYKSAAEMILRDGMSAEARQNKQWLADERWAMFTEALLKHRKLSEEQVVSLMERGLMTAGEAVEGGLIDSMMYWDELEKKLKAADDEELPLIASKDYSEVEPGDLDLDGDKTIAVIHGQGMIFGRKNSVNPIFGILMGHETIISELRRARLDQDVAAVVFRVDSRGGQGDASDLMAHEVEITDKVKPVVTSMVNVAGSGGYWISYRSRKIVADSMTITGSIGSIGGKFNLKGLYDSLGITFDHVTKGPNALMFSDQRDFTAKERARYEENGWAFFNQWLGDIAEHRGMSFEEAEKLAHGRVWTGRQAKTNGLIDEIGDLHRAIQLAKELAGIPADEQVTVKHYPEKKGFFEGIFSGEETIAASARWIAHQALKREITTTLNIVTSHPKLAAETLAE